MSFKISTMSIADWAISTPYDMKTITDDCVRVIHKWYGKPIYSHSTSHKLNNISVEKYRLFCIGFR